MLQRCTGRLSRVVTLLLASAGLVLGICVVGAFATVAAGAWRVVRVAAAEQAIADRASTTKEDSCAGSCAGCDKLCG